jgi:hypothetical protein
VLEIEVRKKENKMATCANCSEKVYKAEEVNALGKSWHKSTFFLLSVSYQATSKKIAGGLSISR